MSDSTTFQPGEILVFTPYIAAFGGVERLLLALCRQLQRYGRPHRVLCFDDTIGLETYADWPLRVHRLKPRRTPWAEARSLRNALRAAHRSGADTPLLFDLKSAFYSGLLAVRPYFLHLTDPPSLLPSDISKRAPSVRTVYPAASEAPRLRWFRAFHAEAVHRLNRRGARGAAKVLAMTERITEELRQLYEIDARIVRPGVSVTHSGMARAESNQCILLSVSRLEANKRIDWMLQALAKLEGADPPLSAQVDWRLDVVGDGSQQALLMDMSRRLGVDRRVVFHGRVTDDELEKIYGAADLFLMPAVQGYGLPALEALARHVAVILHSESGVAEILTDTPWAEIIKVDENELAVAIHNMLNRIRNGSLRPHELPHVPTESAWADSVARECGWTP